MSPAAANIIACCAAGVVLSIAANVALFTVVISLNKRMRISQERQCFVNESQRSLNAHDLRWKRNAAELFNRLHQCIKSKDVH